MPQQNTSRTTTQTSPERPLLKLRSNAAAANEVAKKLKEGNRVRWTEEVVDNEHMDKKKLKICCIFHPQREFGESDSESLSGSSSDSSDDEGNSNRDNKDNCCHQGHKKPGVNAYERQPHYNNNSNRRNTKHS